MKLPAGLAPHLLRSIRLVATQLDTLLLWATLTAADRFMPAPGLPWLAQLGALVLCVLLQSPNADPDQQSWRSQARRLPRRLAVVALAAGLWYLVFSLPATAALRVAAVWLPLTTLAPLVAWRVCAVRTTVWVRSQFQEHRIDIPVGEALLLGGILAASDTLAPGLWPVARGWVLATAAIWIAARGLLRLRSTRAGASLLPVLVVLMLGLVVWVQTAGQIQRGHLVVAVWLVGGIALYRFLLSRLATDAEGGLVENFRWITLGAVGLVLFRPFLQAGVHGTGDALWYGTMLADLMAQLHAGVFPVWTGQSIYQFNGSIYPLRIAPLFHHAGALTDLLTGRALAPFSVLNALLFGTGLLALATTYFSLRALLPQLRGCAWALAILFVGCPGTLGLVFNTDLFMSWTTVPWWPVALYGCIRSFQASGYRPLLILAGALGLLWWGHAPIALWTTVIMSLTQAARLLTKRPASAMIRPHLAAATLFVFVAGYPIGSVLLYPPEPGVNAAGFQGARADVVVHFLNEVRPAVWLPLSAMGRALGDFQLGYALWSALFVTLVLAARSRSVALTALPLAALGLAALLNLPSGPAEALWRLVPDFVRNTTGNWVMNRLYFVQSGLIVFGLAALLAARAASLPRTAARAALAFALCGVLWTMFEARKFAAGSRALVRPPTSGVLAVRPENIQITRFAYLVFPKLPAYFTHGVTAPALENRLFSDTGTLLADNYTAAETSGTVLATPEFFQARADYNFLSLPLALHLVPGRHYLLAFDFHADAAPEGLMQIKGPATLREYSMPEYGEAASFGRGGRHSRYLALPHSADTPHGVDVRYYPAASAALARPFGRVRWIEYIPANLPVDIESWIPYRARVDAPAAGWLETPRMFQTNYEATVDGRPAIVKKSAESLVSIAVPAGRSSVELRYHAPIGLSLLYWVSLAALAGWLAWLLGNLRRPNA